MGKTVTIQKTGKSWKALMALAVLMILLAIPTCAVSSIVANQEHPIPGAATTAWWSWATMLAGFALLIFAKLGAWWSHG